MQPASAVILSIDRLGAAYLGPYGNTWLETPHFCRLAAESALCETVIADSPDLAEACRAWWTGRHALAPDREGLALPALARQAAVESLLVTDDSAVGEHSLAAAFDRRMLVAQPAVEVAADEPAQTGLFRLMERAIAAIREARQPSLVWIHARGMAAAWDAPLPFREQFADLDDPTPPGFVVPPERMLAPGADPDELLGLTHAYAGQVALADLALGMLLDALDEHPLGTEMLLALTSPRGYPLGEHGRIGACDEALYGELLQVPLLVRSPGGRGALARLQSIFQPHELCGAIALACAWSSNSTSRIVNEVEGALLPLADEVAIAATSRERAIRTPAWFLRGSRSEGQSRYELFAKPDDRFEANEIASRGGEVVELLASLLDERAARLRSGSHAELPPLPEVLADVWR